MPQYFCYQCNQTVSLRDADFVCSNCGSDFVEEVRQQSNEAPRQEGGDGRGGQNQSSINLEQWIGDLFETTQSTMNQDAELNRIGEMIRSMANGGANLVPGGGISVHLSVTPQGMFVRNNATGQREGDQNSARPIEELFGMNIPDVLTQLTDNGDAFGNLMEYVERISGNPISEEVIKKYLPMTKVTQKQVDNGAQCTTCFDTFKLDDDVGTLDCSHIFHRPCIEPWLKNKSSCPVCRQPVDFKKWKKQYEQAMASNVLEDLD